MKRKIIVPIILLIIFGFIFVYFGLGDKSSKSINETAQWRVVKVQDEKNAPEARPEVGAFAPDFTWVDTEGKQVKLSDLKGKLVFVNFWATWCPPCREEMPDIQSFYEANGEEIAVLAINLTTSESSLKGIDDFIEINGYTFPILLDPERLVNTRYLIRSIPTSFFVDAKGIIRYKYTGALNKEQIENIFKKIQEQ